MQALISDVFENMGWKVYKLPEIVTILLRRGVVYNQLNHDQVLGFQTNLLRIMLQLEEVYNFLATIDVEKGKKVLVLCDRGAIDPYVKKRLE